MFSTGCYKHILSKLRANYNLFALPKQRKEAEISICPRLIKKKTKTIPLITIEVTLTFYHLYTFSNSIKNLSYSQLLKEIARAFLLEGVSLKILHHTAENWINWLHTFLKLKGLNCQFRDEVFRSIKHIGG